MQKVDTLADTLDYLVLVNGDHFHTCPVVCCLLPIKNKYIMGTILLLYEFYLSRLEKKGLWYLGYVIYLFVCLCIFCLFLWLLSFSFQGLIRWCSGITLDLGAQEIPLELPEDLICGMRDWIGASWLQSKHPTLIPYVLCCVVILLWDVINLSTYVKTIKVLILQMSTLDAMFNIS